MKFCKEEEVSFLRTIRIEIPFLDSGLKIWKAWTLEDDRIIILCIPIDQENPNEGTKLIIGKIKDQKVGEEIFPTIDEITEDSEGIFIGSKEGSLRISPDGSIAYGSHDGEKFSNPIAVREIKGNIIEVLGA